MWPAQSAGVKTQTSNESTVAALTVGLKKKNPPQVTLGLGISHNRKKKYCDFYLKTRYLNLPEALSFIMMAFVRRQSG